MQLQLLSILLRRRAALVLCAELMRIAHKLRTLRVSPPKCCCLVSVGRAAVLIQFLHVTQSACRFRLSCSVGAVALLQGLGASTQLPALQRCCVMLVGLARAAVVGAQLGAPQCIRCVSIASHAKVVLISC
jgi:hypothetical protein